MNKITSFEEVKKMARQQLMIYGAVPKRAVPNGPYLLQWSFHNNTQISVDDIHYFSIRCLGNDMEGSFSVSLHKDEFARHLKSGIEFFDNYLFTLGQVQMLKAKQS